MASLVYGVDGTRLGQCVVPSLCTYKFDVSTLRKRKGVSVSVTVTLKTDRSVPSLLLSSRVGTWNLVAPLHCCSWSCLLILGNLLPLEVRNLR